MVPLTRLNGESFYLNFDLIEVIEACPDTVITLTSGKHLLVQETPEEINLRIVALRRFLHGSGPRPSFLKAGTVHSQPSLQTSTNLR
jgi:flagellar protein FlbD